MGRPARPQSTPLPAFERGRVLTAREIKETKMRMALEQIAKLEVVFEDPHDAARAAVAIAKEALK